MTQLKALGGLRLESSPFSQPKPLVLLSYLSLEGSQQRRHLAELFWQEGNRMKSLSMTLTRLRQGVGEVVEVDDKGAKAKLPSDVKELLESLDKSDWHKASELYMGAFLEGVVLEDWSSELEEWVYTTREYLAERVQYALLNLAEDAAKLQDFDKARDHAERAYKLPGLGGTELTGLKRLYPLLCAGRSSLAPEVRKELWEYGLSLLLTTEEARATFKPTTTTTTRTLPMRGTSFVGRDEELTELATLLNKPKVSLLTLLGPAGVGKTRLALQLAFEGQKLGAFKDGIYFVPLEALSDSSLIPSSLLLQLGLTQQGQTEPFTQLTEFIAEKNILLVLDNFEHLTEGSSFLSRLLSQCPNLKLLVTSREKLRLEEEYMVALGGLSYPTELSDDAKLSEAVQLFRERAQQVQPRFEIEQHLVDVTRICNLVEGLPLGLELAASWVRLMSCSEIAAEIEKGLELLTSASKNVPERHRSLKAAFDYSWQLLTSKEQEVLRKLSVFVGGFRREAASEVAGATIPVLASLVDKSLLRVLASGRYDFHPLLHQFIQEKLAGDKEEKRLVEKNHAEVYARFLTKQETALGGSERQDATDSLTQEIANLELMWRYFVEHANVHRFTEITNPLYLLYINAGRYTAGITLFGKAIHSLDPTDTRHLFALGQLYIRKAGFLHYLASFEQAVTSAERGLEFLDASALAEVSTQVSGLNEIGRNSYALGNYPKAIAAYERAVSLFQKHYDPQNLSIVQGNLSNVYWRMGKYDEAEAIKREVIATCQQLEDWEGLVLEVYNLAAIQLTRRNYNEAKALFEQALALAKDHHMNLPGMMCDLMRGLGNVYRCLKNYELSFEYHQKSLAIARDIGSPFYESAALGGLGYTATGMGDYARARTYFKDCLAMLWQSNDREILFEALIGWAKNEIAQGYYVETTALLGFILNHPELTPEDQREAEEALKGVRAKLAAGALEASLAQGKIMTLGQVLGLALEGSDSNSNQGKITVTTEPVKS